MTKKRPSEDASRAVLEMLAVAQVQGYDVCARLARSQGVAHAEAYGVLYTLESQGLVEGRVAVSADGVERRWYSLTGKGERRVLAAREIGACVPGAAAAAGVFA